MIAHPSARNCFSTLKSRASGLCVVRYWKVAAVSSGPLGPAGPFWFTVPTSPEVGALTPATPARCCVHWEPGTREAPRRASP